MPEWSLLIRSGARAGGRITVGATFDLGRGVEGPGLLADDGKVSRRHARISVTSGGQPRVEDLGSANGTLVNGDPLAPGTPYVLSAGDVIKIGQTSLEVRIGDRAVAEPEPAPAGGSAFDIETLPDSGQIHARPPTPVEQVGSPAAIATVPLPRAADTPSAELIWPGGRLPIPPGALRIGRNTGNQLVIDDPDVGPYHATVNVSEGRYFIADLGISDHGTGLNGERLVGQSRWLHSGDRIDVGGRTMRFLEDDAGGRRFAQPAAGEPEAPIASVPMAGDALTLGRDPSNDVVLDDPNVSRFHAEVRRVNGGAQIRDLGSTNGTRLNSHYIRGSATVEPGGEIGIGSYRLVFTGTGFVQRNDRGAIRLHASGVTTTIKGKTILNGASLAVEPGEFVVVIGESGAGKSTLIKALAGIYEPTSGSITLNGEPVLNRQTDVGYVPQSEIVHPNLTVLEAHDYAAALRLPRDSRRDEIKAAVERVLTQLALAEHAHTRIGSLSGGQRKRAGLGVELLARPSVLFLDEPTTGLDPGLETRMMELFRELAEAGKRSVTVVTHATKNLDLADKVCVMGRGGEPAFIGPPAEAKRFFGVDTYDGIYTALIDRPATEWRANFEAGRGRADVPAPSRDGIPTQAPRPRPNVVRQTLLLALRYAKLLARDRRNLALLIAQVPLIALGCAMLFENTVFLTGRAGDPGNGALLLFLAITSATWFGSIDGAREIIKERALMERERAVGVSAIAYLSSKALVLFTLVAVQVILLVVIVLGLRPLHQSIDHYIAVFSILLATGFAAVGTGLLISAYVTSEDQAGSFIPIALIPQLLFGGAIVAVQDMGGVVGGLSNLIFSRWAFAGSGEAVDLNGRYSAQPPEYFDKYGPDFFTVSTAETLLILGGFALAFFAATWAMLRWQRSRI